MDEYFGSGVHLAHGQVIKTEGTTAFFNGNANQFNSNQQGSPQTFQFDQQIHQSTSKLTESLVKFTRFV